MLGGVEREAASELTRAVGVPVKVGEGSRLVGIAVGRAVFVVSGVLLGRCVLVGRRAVLVGTDPTGEVGLGRMTGLPRTSRKIAGS